MIAKDKIMHFVGSFGLALVFGLVIGNWWLGMIAAFSLGIAKEVFDMLIKEYNVAWDDRGNIGKRYLSQDEIGTPYCITIDYDTLEDGTVTVRDRDSTEQERVKIEDLISHLS